MAASFLLSAKADGNVYRELRVSKQWENKTDLWILVIFGTMPANAYIGAMFKRRKDFIILIWCFL